MAMDYLGVHYLFIAIIFHIYAQYNSQCADNYFSVNVSGYHLMRKRYECQQKDLYG